ncbi:MAG: tRNA (N6-isopentenyl adenosine(37)-C2)-methylthiotransferase MiaB [Clostridia bacterium]|nr:tRNA (N6-isopentenyl adenosine(37)-C2)-methylthiotransferase MiaB [Clostridia bacterium]
MNKPRTVSPEEIREQHEYMQKVRSFWGGRELYVYIETFGCQQNEADSERLCGMAVEMGYTPTTDPAEADLILINTCAVREHAELKALSITGQFKHLKEKKPSLQIGICGCMVSQEHRKEDVKRKYPYVNFLFGTSMLWRFPQILWEAMHAKKRTFHLDTGDPGSIAEGLPVHRAPGHKAWVSIMYGCNNFCTYCVVPYVRGRERSRRPECILEEVRTLAAEGYREITLLGQNVNSYGKDLTTADGKRYDFADLLSDICKIEGDFQIRFMTSHPKDASEKLIDVMAREEKIARAFHLPLQSGSDNILRAMNRVYNRDRYLHLVHYMREKMPEIAITTDIIVGFPGETEEDFEGTLDMLRRVQYDNIYSFLYSPRKGTPAAEMPPVPQEIKAARFQRLLDTQYEIALAKAEALVGSLQTVLVEGRSKTDDTRLTGRTEQNRLVHFEGDDALIGKEAVIRITRAEPHALFGELE